MARLRVRLLHLAQRREERFHAWFCGRRAATWARALFDDLVVLFSGQLSFEHIVGVLERFGEDVFTAVVNRMSLVPHSRSQVDHQV